MSEQDTINQTKKLNTVHSLIDGLGHLGIKKGRHSAHPCIDEISRMGKRRATSCTGSINENSHRGWNAHFPNSLAYAF
ncbi:hypothetical protein [Halobacillus ihumii]|uniref:hypothetical protein n=1 Tax=Halobacillus ihumii TaxID=2686092 RepID=UPI001F082A6F|nr:hypothetical protein [Halobacillus ihumii]